MGESDYNIIAINAYKNNIDFFGSTYQIVLYSLTNKCNKVFEYNAKKHVYRPINSMLWYSAEYEENYPFLDFLDYKTDKIVKLYDPENPTPNSFYSIIDNYVSIDLNSVEKSIIEDQTYFISSTEKSRHLESFKHFYESIEEKYDCCDQWFKKMVDNTL